MTSIFWSPCCSARRAFLLLSFSLSVSSVSAQPATLPFYDCFTGNPSQKFSVDTVYSQIINELTLNITILGNTSQQIVASANSNSLSTLFTEATTLTMDTFSNNSALCDSLRPPSPLQSLVGTNTTYCPIPAGPVALSASIPFNTKNSLTTMNTELRAVDPSGNEILCLSVATTPLHPGPLDSPYGNAHIIFWATIGLAVAYWLIVGIARIVSAWGRGFSRPGPGIWQRFESAGFILASAISGERFSTSPALMRFCSPSLRDIVFHTQWCAALAMVAVQWPPFVYPLLSQTAWASLTYNVTLNGNSMHWNPLNVQIYDPPSNFADQLADTSSVIYINQSVPNTLFLLPTNTTNGMQSFAWSVGVNPQDLFEICLSLFLAIIAGTTLLSLFVWTVDWVFSQRPSGSLPTSTNLTSPTVKVRSPRLSAGSKDMLDAHTNGDGSSTGFGHSYPFLRRRWLRPEVSSFHSSVLIGNLVRVLVLFHLPVTIFSCYEFSTGSSASSLALGALSFTLFSVIAPSVLLVRLARTPTTKLYDETRTLLALGPLYNHYRQGSQLFSGLLFLSNLVLGVTIGCGQRSGTAQAIIILSAEVISALVTSVWLPWGAGAGMGLISFLFCVARIVVAVLLVILTPTISIGSGAAGWVAYGIVIVLCLVYLAFFLILVIKVIEAVVRIAGQVGFDRSRRPVDGGLIGVLSLVGCCGPRSGRERRRYKATEVRHSSTVRDSFNAPDSSYAPPNASFAQKVKGSGSSHHSSGQPPSVLRPEHALQPYREDSDDDAESGHIMGAWQPFPGPGPGSRPSYDRTSNSTPPKNSNSGFSRVGGGRAHYESPYAIAGGAAGSSTFTFPSMERKGSGPAPGGPGTKTIYDDDELPTPAASIANVARLPALTNSGLPPGAMMPHRTKSQTAIIIGDVAALNATPVHVEEEPSIAAKTMTKTISGESRTSDPDQPKKRHWYNIRRNRRHSDGDRLDSVMSVGETEPEGDSSSGSKDAGKSFVVIRARKPQSSQPDTRPHIHRVRYSMDETGGGPSSQMDPRKP